MILAVIGILAVSLLTVGAAAAPQSEQDPLEVNQTAPVETTADQESVTATVVVTNNGSQPVQNATLTVTNVDDGLSLESDDNVTLGQLNASEQKPVDLAVAVGTDNPGSYAVVVEVSDQRRQPHDNATVTIDVVESMEDDDTRDSNTAEKEGDDGETSEPTAQEDDGWFDWNLPSLFSEDSEWFSWDFSIFSDDGDDDGVSGWFSSFLSDDD